MRIYDRAKWKLLEDNTDLEPICEVNDIELDISQPIRLNGILYTVCILGYDYAVVKSLEISELADEAEELYGENEVTCPYCGHHIANSFEMDDEEDEYECDYCGSVFAYQREITVEYNMQPIRKNTDIKEIVF